MKTKPTTTVPRGGTQAATSSKSERGKSPMKSSPTKNSVKSTSPRKSPSKTSPIMKEKKLPSSLAKLSLAKATKSANKTPNKTTAKAKLTVKKTSSKFTSLRKSTADRTPEKAANKPGPKKASEKSPSRAPKSPVSPRGKKAAGSTPSKVKESLTGKKKEMTKSEKVENSKWKPGLKKSKDALRGCKKSPKESAKTKVVKKKKVERELSTSQFIDLWTLANIGKREASLNASMKVNIMYESVLKSPPKVSTADDLGQDNQAKYEGSSKKSSPDKKEESPKKGNKTVSKASKTSKRPLLSARKTLAGKKLSLSSALRTRRRNSQTPKKASEQASGLKKRKSPDYRIFKESEPASKSRKKSDNKNVKSPLKTAKNKTNSKRMKKKKKTTPSGHQLCDIMERSPRQASLIAKAMIAMEQEEEVMQDSTASAARTRVYDWHELRPYFQSQSRRIVWMDGKVSKDKSKGDARQKDASDAASSDMSSMAMGNIENEALHSALLRTLHKVGDPRLLREFYRAQRDDYLGDVDVEFCETLEQPMSSFLLSSLTTNGKFKSPTAGKNKSSGQGKPKPKASNTRVASPAKSDTFTSEVSFTPIVRQAITPIKPAPVSEGKRPSPEDKCSSSKGGKSPQPCRVATPIPQFPLGQRASHMTSFIHHPVPHPHLFHQYQQQQQQQKKQQQQPQHHNPLSQQSASAHHQPPPIKVTPFSPSPAYIYQLVDRTTQGASALFVPPTSPAPNPPSLPYNLTGGGGVAPDHNLSALALGRRSMAAYNQDYGPSPLQIPLQQVGLNFQPYYSTNPLTTLQPSPTGQPNLSSLTNLPGLQHLTQYPLMAHQQLPHALTQFGSPYHRQVGLHSPFHSLPSAHASAAHVSTGDTMGSAQGGGLTSQVGGGVRDAQGFLRPQPIMPPPPPAHVHHRQAQSSLPSPFLPPLALAATPGLPRPPSAPLLLHHQPTHQFNHSQAQPLQPNHGQEQKQQDIQPRPTNSTPMESLRCMNPPGIQAMQARSSFFLSSPALRHPQPNQLNLNQPIFNQAANSPPRPSAMKAMSGGTTVVPKSSCSSNVSNHTNHAHQQHSNHTPDLSVIRANAALCKKELFPDTPLASCDTSNKKPVCNAEVQTAKQTIIPRRISTENADISDLLHSVHNAMFETDNCSSSPADPNRVDNLQQAQPVPLNSPFFSSQLETPRLNANTDPHPYLSKVDSSHQNSNSGNKLNPCLPAAVSSSMSSSYSVSTILDMPNQKMKSEPVASGNGDSNSNDMQNPPQVMQNSLNLVVNSPSNLHIAFPGPINGNPGDKGLTKIKKEKDNKKVTEQQFSKKRKMDSGPKKDKCFKSSKVNKVGGFVVIEDSDESSEDEPLAKLAIKDTLQTAKPQKRPLAHPVSHKAPKKFKTMPSKAKKSSPKSKLTVTPIKIKLTKPMHVSPIKKQKVKVKPAKSKSRKKHFTAIKSPAKQPPGVSKVTKSGKTKAKNGAPAKAKPKKTTKKARSHVLSPQSLPRAINNHGWSWLGEGYIGPVPKLTIAREEPVRMRRCFQCMQHTSGERIKPGDCVILNSDGDGSAPYVARVTRLWEHLNGEMMFSMLWYYQPEHTVQGREPEDGEQELFASKHREENSVACIDDKCYVLMYNEYCRLEAEAARCDQGQPMPRWREEIPNVSSADQSLRRPQPPSNACVDNIWFCRYDYDIRKKYVRKPKHKKSNLRWRPPIKLV